MARPTKTVINCETGVSTIVELTDEEMAERAELNAKYEAQQAVKEAELKAQAEAKTSAIAKLTALGLTEDEAKALIG